MFDTLLNKIKDIIPKKKKKMTRSKYQAQIRKSMRKTRLRPWAFNTLFSIFAIIIIVNLFTIIDWEKDNKKINKIEKEIEEDVVVKEIKDKGESINPPDDKNSDYWYYINFPFNDVDFTELIKKNSDTVGFINVRGTNINYPIVQASDNDYYLNHAFDKSYNEAGWVYMDYRNNNFTDFNTIIYGHGRLNKTVFGSLKNVLDEKWQNNRDNYIVTISSLTTNYVYQIFSLYTIPSETYYIQTKFANDFRKNKWITEMNNRNIAPINSPANINDKVITLSTSQNNDGGRIVVHAKLIKIQNKETD